MSSFQQKVGKHAKNEEKTVWRDKASIRSDTVMTKILELSNRELKITMNNMLRALMEKVDNM